MILSYSLWNQTERPLHEISKILFLHGMGGTGKLWRPIASALENEMAILAPDQRGHGKSQVVEEGAAYTPLEYGKDVAQTLKSTEFHPCWVVGHSMGVRTAVALAHLQPEWIQGLILVDLGFTGAAGGGLGDGLAQFLKLLPLEFSSREEARAFMQERCPDPAIGQYLMAVSTTNPDGRITFPFDKSALIQTIEAARGHSIKNWVKEYASLNKPVLVLRGVNSLVWTQDEFMELKNEFSECKTVQFIEFQNAGHGLPFEQRLEFVRTIRDVVKSHSKENSKN